MNNIILMNKNIIFIISPFILILIIFWGCMKTPERPSYVSENAVWSGDWKRGGYWIDLVEKKENYTFRYKLYTGLTGELMLDADFKLREDCHNLFSQYQIEEMTLSYLGTYIRTGIKHNDIHCDLIRDSVYFNIIKYY